MKETKAKVQRIKMRLRNNPVKLDGSITEMDLNGKWFVVVFDGPYPDTKFWIYGNGSSMVTDKELDIHGMATEGTQFWDVL